MKHYSNYILSIAFLLILFIGFPFLVHAQPDPCTDPDLNCPIDGGLSALLVIGVGYGIKKYKDNRKSSMQSSPLANKQDE
ncbi:MAG: hypothetical protein ABI237_06785 [Ginsengibacter sp.]